MAISFFNHVSLKDRAFLSRQLATMMEAGLNLPQAIKILRNQTRKAALVEVLGGIQKDVESGKSFSSAIARFPNVFDPVFASVARAGEMSGKLVEVLKSLADQQEKDRQFVNRVLGALLYPSLILVALVIVGVVVVTQIIPQLKEIFLESGVKLPFATRLIIWVSDFLTNNWLMVIFLLLAGSIGLVLFVHSPGGVLLIHQLKLKGPAGLGNKIYMTRVARILGLLVSSGVPIVESVRLTAEASGNRFIEASLEHVATELEKGVPMSLPLSKDPFFPPIFAQMILVGEQTGKLDEILTGLTTYFESETESVIRNLNTLFEPALIILIGIGVGFMVFAVLLPIYQLTAVL